MMEKEEDDTTETHVNAISFNQTGDCCAYATNHGFTIHTLLPQQESICRDLGGAPLSHVEMLYSTNIMVVVGKGMQHPAFPCTKVIIWDDSEQRAIGEICHGSPVKNVKLGKNRIAVCLEDAVYVYDLEHLECIHKIETVHNPLGIFDMVTAEKSVVAALGRAKGEVQLISAGTTQHTCACHRGRIAALALSPNGRYLATASKRGTIIRVFSTENGSKVEELRRGTHPATIQSLAFSFDMPTWLACTSDKRTLHIFHLSTDNQEKEVRKWFSWLRLAGNPPKRSCLQVSTEEHHHCLVSFHAYSPNTLTVLSKDTKMYQRILTLVDDTSTTGILYTKA